MNDKVQRVYELFLGRYVINDGRISKVLKFSYYSCGGTCRSYINGKEVIFCTDCKYPEGHHCYIDYLTGLTYETKSLL